MNNLIADLCLPGQTPPDCIKDPIPTGTFSTTGTYTPADIVNRLVIFIFPIVGLIFFINLLFAGFAMMTSGGDPKKLESAKGRLTTSLIGMVILFCAFWITQIVAFIFGLKGIF